MNEAIAIRGLSKRFGSKSVLNDVELSVRAGEIYGFLGLNGAGKTTTMRTILKMIRPDAGQVRVFGQDVTEKGFDWNQIGYLIETPKAYPNLTVYENLHVVALLRNVSPSRVHETIANLGLSPYAGVLAKNLSLGNKQRLGIAKALLHRPPLLILDEPINGLDPGGIAEIRSLLLKLSREDGVTIFVSSHLLDEIAKIADSIGIINAGTMIAQTKYQDLIGALEGGLVVKTRADSRARAILSERGIKTQELQGGGFLVDSQSAVQPEGITTILVESACPPFELYKKEVRFEDYFLKLVNE